MNNCPKKGWRDLKTDPPTGDEYAVLLWPILVDAGHSYTLSNPEYALIRGVTDGYMMWLEFELAPDHNDFERYKNKRLGFE